MGKKNIILLTVLLLLIAGGAFAYWYFVLHIDTGSEPQQTTQSEADKPASDKDVAALIADTGYLSTFEESLKLAGIATELEGAGPYTVFAPKNSAFTALPSGTIERLQKPENTAQLASIMNYHIATGSILSSQLTEGQKVKTVNGQEVIAALEGKSVYLVDAKGDKALVTKSDIKASNGVIHVIDAVLLPQ